MSAPIGLVEALKITLRHCAGRASATASDGIPPRVQASASAATSAAEAGAGSKGENVVSPFTSHCTWPGSSSLPAGNVVPRITRGTCRAIVSSLPTPFMTDATAPSANACAVAAMAESACIAFVATIPKSHGGSAAGSLVACRRAWTSPAPESRNPSRLIASTCAWKRSNAHTSTSSRVARFAANSEPTAPQPTMQILTMPVLLRVSDDDGATGRATARARR